MADCRAAVITAHNEPLEIQRVPIPELVPALREKLGIEVSDGQR